MLKIISLFVLFFLVVFNGLSLADIFKCTRPDGSVFFTDDPSKVPKTCVVERVTEVPSTGIISDAPLQPQAQSAGKPVLSQTKSEVIKSFASFKNEAANLVEEFQSARHRVATSSFVTDKLKARRELVDIKTQKERLLKEINVSSLISLEKEELVSLLSPIAE